MEILMNKSEAHGMSIVNDMIKTVENCGCGDRLILCENIIINDVKVDGNCVLIYSNVMYAGFYKTSNVFDGETKEKLGIDYHIDKKTAETWNATSLAFTKGGKTYAFIIREQ